MAKETTTTDKGGPVKNPAPVTKDQSGTTDSGDIRGKDKFPPQSTVAKDAPRDVQGKEPLSPESLREMAKTSVPFSNELRNNTDNAVEATKIQLEEDNDYLAALWVEYHRNLGSMGDWVSATETQKAAFRRLVKRVTRDARS